MTRSLTTQVLEDASNCSAEPASGGWVMGGVRRRVICAGRLVSVVAAMLLAGCGDVTRPTDPRHISVMTRNVYVGADLQDLLEIESLAELPLAAASVWAAIQATAFAERAGALAAEITQHRPHLIGLQEVALFRMQRPGDFFVGNFRSAEDTVLDYLALLLDSLGGRGQSYGVAAELTGVDAEGPVLLGGRFDDLRISNREVILARADVVVEASATGLYETNQTFTLAGVAAPFLRGWASVQASVHGRTVRFISTHLEPSDTGPEAQVDQGREVVELLSTATGPVVLVGDFNSPADGSGTATYGHLVTSGLADSWADVRAGDTGYTCCHAPDLLNGTEAFRSRIDLVLLRGGVEAIDVSRVGLDPMGRTRSGLWASDHAGVVATLQFR